MRGHPKGRRWPCRHCDDVETYRGQRAADEDKYHRRGGWRDPHFTMITFKEWLLKPGRFEEEGTWGSSSLSA